MLKPNPTTAGLQLFHIYAVSKRMSGVVTVNAEHRNTVLSTVRKYCNTLTGKAITLKTEAAGGTYTAEHNTFWQIAQTRIDKGSHCTEMVKLNGRTSSVPDMGRAPEPPRK